jgi:D-lactate dehydrogenase
MIGSEGTLGFIAEAVLNTVPDDPFKSTGLLFFDDVPRACSTIAALRDSGARALELMDRPSLRAIEEQPGVPEAIRELPAEAAAILVEYQCGSETELDERRRACDALLPRLPLAATAEFTRESARRDTLWRVRKGLIPSVGAMRRRNTSFIIEDVVFPVPRLAQGVAELQDLFAEFGYDDAIVFGHAKDGNLHFVLTQAFDDPADVARYDGFMRALAPLVAGRHGGALKAEHGTGRNMAPFVAAEWGEDALALMRELKRLVDPDGLLNPGVILNDDPAAHVTHLKDLPTIEKEADSCIECGFCERHCPSRDLTLTPRQRIVIRREMTRLRATGQQGQLRELERDYVYAGLETCAADGLCALACPVGIDTGLLVKRLRRESHSASGDELACVAASHFALVERAARVALRGARAARSWVGPRWSADLPRAAPPLETTAITSATDRIYFASCQSRILGAATAGDEPLVRALVAVAARAGISVAVPDTTGLCCGLAFGSKGYDRAQHTAVNRTVEALWSWSAAGKRPVVVDASPCALTLKEARRGLTRVNRARFDRLTIEDGIELAHDSLLPRLTPRAEGEITLHPVCSVRKMNLVGKLRRIGEACSAHVEIPSSAGCCGFAGDRGFTVPELTAAALRAEAAEVGGRIYDGYYSSSRTCEIGLTRATRRPYRSIWHLLDRQTEPRTR